MVLAMTPDSHRASPGAKGLYHDKFEQENRLGHCYQKEENIPT